MSDKKDFYEILEIKRDASQDEIKKAYRKLAVTHHPDKHQDGDKAAAEIKFKEISEAYETLSDPDKRSSYDKFGHQENGNNFNFGGFNMDDIFNMFHGGRRQQQPKKGNNFKIDLVLEFKEAVLGCEKEIELKRHHRCVSCKGLGATKFTTCPKCKGTGNTRSVTNSPFIIEIACDRCNQGKIPNDRCKDCNGKGFDKDEIEKISINIPSGVDDGFQLRLQGKGEEAPEGGINGDLFINLHVKKHDFFERHGVDLYCQIPVSYTQMINGGEVEVPTLDKTIKLKIPKNSNPETRLKIKGKGVPSNHRYESGDIIVLLEMDSPSNNIPKEYKDVLENLAEMEKKYPGMNIKNFREKHHG